MAIPKTAKFKYEIKQSYTIPKGVAGNYRNGYAKPEGIVLHSSGNPNASLESEISYMSRNYRNAFTNAWAGHNKIVEIANTDYPAWGAGAIANKRFVQIEVTEDKRLTNKQKLQAIDREAFWAAVQLAYYNLPCTNAINDGKGTVWTHEAVTKFLGGTTHVDPTAFYHKAGTTTTEVFNQIKAYYDILIKGGDTNRVVSIADKKGDKAVIKSTEKEVPKNHSKKPNKKGETQLFKVGDTVKLNDKATHWHKWYDKVVKQGGTRQSNGKIAGQLKDSVFQVTWLPTNGTVELAELVDGKQKPQRYVAYEWDIKHYDPLYKVQTGAFNQKENAEKKADELKKDGYDTYITKK